MKKVKQRQGRSAPRKAADKAAGQSLPHICLLHPDQLGGVAQNSASSRHRQIPPDIGRRLREIRLRKNMTLSEIEVLSGVSKSMLSQIERGKVNPTFARVWHLTRSLGVGVGELLGEVSSRFEEITQFEHVKVYRTPTITSSDGLCTTKILNPIRFQLPFEWYELTLQRGGALRANAHGNGAWEHMTVVNGRVVVEIGDDEVTLEAGETVRYSAEQPHGVRNNHTGISKVMLVLVAVKELAAKSIPFGPDEGA
ncbi:MAG: XRE family transcriptional regulator [Hyphomicrobiaceae bacterium]